MNKRKMKGFTLLEMLIVVAIIAILVAIGIPAYSASLAKTKEAVCLSNRRSLLSVVYSEYLLGNYNSPEEAFNAIYKGDDEKTYVCPEDGVFSWVSDSHDEGHIVCSFHGSGDPGGDDPGGSTYLGTDIVIVDNYWPTAEDYKDNEYGNVTVSAGSIFQYTDEKYYIVTEDIPISKSYAVSGPGPEGDMYGWMKTQQITGRIITYDGTDDINDLHRGDIWKVGNDYYVFKTGGHVGRIPTNDPTQWYKIP